MYKKAEEGMISERREASLNLRAVYKRNQSATKLRRYFCLSLVCSVPGKFNRTRKTIFGRQRAQMAPHGGLRPCERIQRILTSKIPVYCSAILFSVKYTVYLTFLNYIGMFEVFFRYTVGV